MSNPDPENQIQTEPTEVPATGSDASDLLPSDDATHRRRTRKAGSVFGTLAGIPLGALAGAVGCWLTDFGDYGWHGAICGALAGIFFGASVGFLERTLKGDVAKPVVAGAIGGILGLAIALVAFYGMDVVDGAWLLLCGGPVGGFVLGTLLDRAFEASMQRSWLTAIAFGVPTVAACFAIAFLIVEYSDPDPKDVAKAAAKGIAMQGAKIRKITLDPPEHRKYTGTLEVFLDGQIVRYHLTVHVRHNKVNATWIPRE